MGKIIRYGILYLKIKCINIKEVMVVMDNKLIINNKVINKVFKIKAYLILTNNIQLEVG